MQIEYEPQGADFVTDAEIIRTLNHFLAAGTPPVRPDLGAKREYGDGFQRLIIYTEPGESNRLEIRYEDLPDDDDASRQEAHNRSVAFLEALAPRYFERPVNLVMVEPDSLTYAYR